ncbi:MAG: polysaccharide export protein [Rhizobiales bacterium]|nr:polysaccharide export protein [Hyphomicrobiales bacterium]MBI3673094.1 polysaccharide export protein [Hyphomicrobiales bacterium]
MRKRFLVTLAVIVPLAGCANNFADEEVSASPAGTGLTADGTVADGTVASVTRLPARNSAGALEPFGTQGKQAAYEYGTGYRVGAGDRLTIRVAGETDLTADYLVDGSGNISLPYIQTLNVGGLTASQIERLVEARLRAGYLRDPKVSAQVTTLRPFYILGEVNTSGSFAYQPGITVQNAIAIAGGYSPRADHQLVLLTRKNATGTATAKVPVTTQIYPGDIIYVRERWF